MRRIFVLAIAVALGSEAVGQEASPEVRDFTYALQRICGWHLEGTSSGSLFASEVNSHGWSQAPRGGGVTYDKAGDWGRIQVMYSTRGYSGRCIVSVTPASESGLDVAALRSTVATLVAERFPNAKHEKDRAPGETNSAVTTSVWTAENGRWSVQLGEMPVVEKKPVLRVVWDRAF